MRVVVAAACCVARCLFCAVITLLTIAPSCQCTTLSLEKAISDAVGSSFDTQIARTRAFQLHADVKAAKADYLPSLVATATSEYDKGLDKGAQPVFSVGNSALLQKLKNRTSCAP